MGLVYPHRHYISSTNTTAPSISSASSVSSHSSFHIAMTRTQRREVMVRRAVARRIVQQVRNQRKTRQQHSRRSASTAECKLADDDESTAAVAAIAALAAAMSATRTGNYIDDQCVTCDDDSRPVPVLDNTALSAEAEAEAEAVLDAECQIIQRIIELQREKERLLRLMHQGKPTST
ncbi:hypothetical protein BX661DRAFT_223480 [Kickxella alabastrina]|uniref:uncharacterized protein n=1 Tax=Kickxella alabastrina TaxID=61397 RepID=UPI002220CF88|nr:uncharacterized protein BX661DRAFT_223480 [Kickxella alabastrina]KAI7832018.1 hypothetical protein BX661DRAFT_223480 [Kickxella alabastrina]